MERGKRSTIFLEKTRGPSSIRRTLDCFKGNIGKTSENERIVYFIFKGNGINTNFVRSFVVRRLHERRDGAHFSAFPDTQIPLRTELN